MKNRTFARAIALVLVLGMAVMMLSACQKAPVEPSAAPNESTAPTESTEPSAQPEGAQTPLVVGYSPFSEKFSTFYADTAYDQDVVDITQVSLLTTDRTGGIIYNAIEGETVPYNGTDYTYYGPADITVEQNEDGTTTYTAKLRQDITFSDGTPMTADDVIFTYYVFCDPAYVGSATLNSYGIVGLKDYQTQTTSEVYDKYNAIFDALLALPADGDATAAGGTAEQLQWLTTKMEELWRADVRAQQLRRGLRRGADRQDG